MTRKEATEMLKALNMMLRSPDGEPISDVCDALGTAIEALKNEPILCEDCRHRNTWDNGRLVPQYYRCGMGVKFRDYGYVREDDYCPFGERREE